MNDKGVVRRAHGRRRVTKAVDAGLADAIDLIVLAVRAGMLPPLALRSAHRHFAPPLRDATAAALTELDRGTRFCDALPIVSERLGPALDPLVDGLAVADRDGLPLGPVLERLAADARAHRRRQVDAAARQLPVRLALPLVLCTLPSFVLLAVVPLLLTALSSLHR
ncbi:MAG: type II secretion system F family protein [Ilumatobacteraceae bacterium]